VKKVIPYVFLLPFLIIVTVFYLLPAVFNIYISLTDMDSALEGKFIGLENFRIMFSMEADPVMPQVVLNTVLFVAFSLILTLGLGLLIALLTHDMKGFWRNFFRVIWFIPRTTPPVVWGFLWVWAFDPSKYGLMNMLMRSLGLGTKSWLSQHPLLIVILANGILGVPYAMTILGASLETIPTSIIEASQIDGANWFQTTFYIKIPLLKWPLAFLTIWYSLSFLTSFQYIYIITKGGPFYDSTTLALYAYKKAFMHMDLGYGAALSIILILISLVTVIVLWKKFYLGALSQEGA